MPSPLLCLGCGYELPSTPGAAGICPECGRRYTHAELVHESQRNVRLAKVSLFTAALVLGTIGVILLLAWFVSV